MIVGCFYHQHECLLVAGFLITHTQNRWSRWFGHQHECQSCCALFIKPGNAFCVTCEILCVDLLGDFWPERSQLEFKKCSHVILQIFKAHFKNVALRPWRAFWFLKSFLWLVYPPCFWRGTTVPPRRAPLSQGAAPPLVLAPCGACCGDSALADTLLLLSLLCHT